MAMGKQFIRAVPLVYAFQCPTDKMINIETIISILIPNFNKQYMDRRKC